MNGVNMRVPIGYKFILGFIAVVAAAAFAPGIVDKFDLPEWLREPVSFLTAIVIGLLIGSFFTKSFTRRLNNLTEAARRISEGDLTAMTGHDADVQWFIDETSDLKDAVQLMSENLRALVEHMQDAVGNLALSHEAYGSVVIKGQASSKDVIAGASSIFSGALAQANHIGEANETVMSMTKLADDMADKVTETASASAKVNSMVQRGATTATSAIEKMESMFKGIENTEGAAWRLKDKLNDIPKILDVITHISRQTDLLALNATIEASKAGEHGKGFAMVAEEFRRFADNTNDSVRDVSSIVKELKMEVERVVQTATEGASYLKA
ncbi:MAG: methyl-accepting chemotaxis protein, partial [Deltaproteobacteria bacterium]|nr:methyl-accepting chemotaxis protein [Deltaproteobacteria bacterium]